MDDIEAAEIARAEYEQEVIRNQGGGRWEWRSVDVTPWTFELRRVFLAPEVKELNAWPRVGSGFDVYSESDLVRRDEDDEGVYEKYKCGCSIQVRKPGGDRSRYFNGCAVHGADRWPGKAEREAEQTRVAVAVGWRAPIVLGEDEV